MHLYGEKLAARPVTVAQWQPAVPERVGFFDKAKKHDSENEYWSVRVQALIFISGAVASWGLVALLFVN